MQVQFVENLNIINPKIDFKITILLILAMLYVTIDLTANVLVYKLVTVGPVVQPGGIFIYPLTFLMGDIIAELYGYKMARFVAYFDIFCTFIFSIAALIIINLPSPSYWQFSEHYQQVLGHLLRINVSVFLGLIVGVTLNIYLISKWRRLVGGRYFWLRSVGSTAIGEGMLLVISGVMVFYGTMPTSDMVNLLIVDYIIRMLYAVVGGIPATILVYVLRSSEAFHDTEPSSLRFENPFKMGSARR